MPISELNSMIGTCARVGENSTARVQHPAVLGIHWGSGSTPPVDGLLRQRKWGSMGAVFIGHLLGAWHCPGDIKSEIGLFLYSTYFSLLLLSSNVTLLVLCGSHLFFPARWYRFFPRAYTFSRPPAQFLFSVGGIFVILHFQRAETNRP